MLGYCLLLSVYVALAVGVVGALHEGLVAGEQALLVYLGALVNHCLALYLTIWAYGWVLMIGRVHGSLEAATNINI